MHYLPKLQARAAVSFHQSAVAPRHVQGPKGNSMKRPGPGVKVQTSVSITKLLRHKYDILMSVSPAPAKKRIRSHKGHS